MACPALQFFSALSHKRQDFRGKEKFYIRNVCFDTLYKFCLKRFSFQEKLSDVWSKGHVGVHVKYPLFLSGFNETKIFATDFRKMLKYQISRKCVQWEPRCCMRNDVQTDMKLIVTFFNSANAPKNTDFPPNAQHSGFFFFSCEPEIPVSLQMGRSCLNPTYCKCHANQLLSALITGQVQVLSFVAFVTITINAAQ